MYFVKFNPEKIKVKTEKYSTGNNHKYALINTIDIQLETYDKAVTVYWG